MFQIPRKVEYALLAVLYLARRPPGEWSSLRDIVDFENIPRDFLPKILKDLADAGLVESARGAAGGYRLARPAVRISFLSVVEATSKPLAINLCSDHGEGCAASDHCAMSHVWRDGEAAMKTVFARTTIADLLVERAQTPLTIEAFAARACGVDELGAARQTET